MKNFVKLSVLVVVFNLFISLSSRFGDIGIPIVKHKDYQTERAYEQEFQPKSLLEIAPPDLVTGLLNVLNYHPKTGSAKTDLLKAIDDNKINLTFYVQILKKPDDRARLSDYKLGREFSFLHHFILEHWFNRPEFQADFMVGLFGPNGINLEKKAALDVPIGKLELRKAIMEPTGAAKKANPTGPWKRTDLMRRGANTFGTVAGRDIASFWTVAISPVIKEKRDVLVTYNIIIENDEVASEVEKIGKSKEVTSGDVKPLVETLDASAAKLTAQGKPDDAAALKAAADNLQKLAGTEVGTTPAAKTAAKEEAKEPAKGEVKEPTKGEVKVPSKWDAPEEEIKGPAAAIAKDEAEALKLIDDAMAKGDIAALKGYLITLAKFPAVIQIIKTLLPEDVKAPAKAGVKVPAKTETAEDQARRLVNAALDRADLGALNNYLTEFAGMPNIVELIRGHIKTLQFIFPHILPEPPAPKRDVKAPAKAGAKVPAKTETAEDKARTKVNEATDRADLGALNKYLTEFAHMPNILDLIRANIRTIQHLLPGQPAAPKREVKVPAKAGVKTPARGSEAEAEQLVYEAYLTNDLDALEKYLISYAERFPNLTAVIEANIKAVQDKIKIPAAPRGEYKVPAKTAGAAAKR